MKTTKDIAAALLAATTLTEDTTADFREYRRAKRATGAPVDMEDAVAHAANRCQGAMVELRDYLGKARHEADERLAALAHGGVRMGQFTWFVLDGRKTGEDLNSRLCAARDRFEDAVRLWAALADRIVATDEDRVAAAAARLAAEEARIARAWAGVSAKAARAYAKRRGFDPSGDREALIDRFVRAGMEPTADQAEPVS